MAALKAPPTRDFLQKTLGAQLLAGVTAAATFNNTTGVQNLPGVFIVDRINSNDVETPGLVEVIGYAGTSGSTATTLERGLAGTTDQDHAIDAIVEFVPDVVWAQSMYDAITKVVSATTGNLDTTKVIDLTSTQTMTNKTLTSPVINTPTSAIITSLTEETTIADGDFIMLYDTSATALRKMLRSNFASQSADGWTAATGTWTYASANTITVASGAASIYTVGDRVKFTQTTVKYGVITAVANTLLTIAVNTDYVVANAAITLPYYSHDASPLGYPGTFNCANRQQLSITGKTMVLTGWEFIVGDGTANDKNKTVTFNTAFSAAPFVQTTYLTGKNSAGDPAAITIFTTNWTAANIAFAGNLATTTMVVYMYSTNALTTNQYWGISWEAVGTL